MNHFCLSANRWAEKNFDPSKWSQIAILGTVFGQEIVKIPINCQTFQHKVPEGKASHLEEGYQEPPALVRTPWPHGLGGVGEGDSQYPLGQGGVSPPEAMTPS